MRVVRMRRRIDPDIGDPVGRRDRGGNGDLLAAADFDIAVDARIGPKSTDSLDSVRSPEIGAFMLMVPPAIRAEPDTGRSTVMVPPAERKLPEMGADPPRSMVPPIAVTSRPTAPVIEMVLPAA